MFLNALGDGSGPRLFPVQSFEVIRDPSEGRTGVCDGGDGRDCKEACGIEELTILLGTLTRDWVPDTQRVSPFQI
jgi:hypothetical protein